MKKGYLTAAAAFAAVAIYVIWESSHFPPGRAGVPGPAIYPTAVALLMLFSAISLAISGIRMSPEENRPVGILSDDNKRVYASMVGLVVYIVVMYFAGFFTASAAMLFGFIKWFGKYKAYVCALWAVGLAAIVYVVFRYVLLVPLRFGALL